MREALEPGVLDGAVLAHGGHPATEPVAEVGAHGRHQQVQVGDLASLRVGGRSELPRGGGVPDQVCVARVLPESADVLIELGQREQREAEPLVGVFLVLVYP